MNTRDAARNVRMYKLYRTFCEPLMWGPILLSYLIHVGGMTLADIYFMESIVVFGFIFLEVPSGALADLIGRKKTVLAGSLCQAASTTWFMLMDSPFDAWGANITWMVGASLSSGADSAFLYDSLKEIGREDEYRKIEGAATGNRLLLTAICSLGVGFLAVVNMRLPLILSLPGIILSASATFFFKEPPQTKAYAAHEHMSMMKTSIMFVANHREVKWIVGFATLIGVASKVWFFTYNPYFEAVGLDLRLYGIMFFLMNAIAWFFSRYAHEIGGRMGEQGAIVSMIALVAFPILLMGSVLSKYSVGFTLLQNAVRGFGQPFIGGFLNRHLNSENRATVLSINSAISGLSQGIALGAFGFLLKAWPLHACLLFLGVSVLALGVLCIASYRMIFKR